MVQDEWGKKGAYNRAFNKEWDRFFCCLTFGKNKISDKL